MEYKILIVPYSVRQDLLIYNYDTEELRILIKLKSMIKEENCSSCKDCINFLTLYTLVNFL